MAGKGGIQVIELGAETSEGKCQDCRVAEKRWVYLRHLHGTSLHATHVHRYCYRTDQVIHENPDQMQFQLHAS